ncbi:ATP-binding protein [Anaerolineales bacterium HSG25]|nr:ATP-binding protein [Anaerolineales bacterium HSG25]
MFNKFDMYSPLPIFLNSDKHQVLATLRVIVGFILFVSVIVVGTAGYIGRLDVIIGVIISNVVVFVALFLIHHRYFLLASLLVPSTVLLEAIYFSATGHGLRDVTMFMFPLSIMMAAMLLGRRGLISFTITSIIYIFALYYAERTYLIVTCCNELSNPVSFVGIVVIIATIAVILDVMVSCLIESLNQTQANEQRLTKSNRDLKYEVSQREQIRLLLKQSDFLLRQRNHELTLLNQMGQELTTSLDIEQVHQHLLETSIKTVNAETASIWQSEDPAEEEKGLVCRAFLDQNQNVSLLNMRLQPGQGVAGWVAENGRTARVNSVSDDPRFYPEFDRKFGFTTRSLLAIPLQRQGQVVGVLQIVNKSGRGFSDSDQLLIETLATSAVIALKNAQLVESLRSKTKQLQTQNEELNAFAHTVAHDLKSPLSHMIGFADYFRDNFSDLSDEECQEYLAIISKNAHKMSSIVDELLILADVRQAKKVKLEPVDMLEVVGETKVRLASLLNQVQLKLVEPERWPAAVGYAPWLEEVWANYVANAIKYGGDPPRIEVGATEQENGQARFWVRDNGLGLTVEEQESLFVPFTRLNQVKIKGHGLGLSIVRRIVEKLGGQVGVDSGGLDGTGSTFWFELPLANQKPEEFHWYRQEGGG